MRKWLSALLLANAIDAAATVYVLTHNLGIEHNPIVRFLFSLHPIVFLGVKTTLAGMSVGAVLAGPQDGQMRGMLAGVTIFYGVLSLYQVAVLLSIWI